MADNKPDQAQSPEQAFTPRLPTDVRVNPILSRADWQRRREACAEDPGAFHGDIAANTIHWYDPEHQAWVMKDRVGRWSGWHPYSGEDYSRAGSWLPWEKALDDADAPVYRWFTGAQTNAAFNEVDRHVFAGNGEDPAFFFEGDRWDGSANGSKGGPVHAETLTRRELLYQSVLAAHALKSLGLGKGDRVALNMPNILPQIVWTEACKRLGAIYTPVFGGFSDKTLADRIENAGARVVITADGASRNAENLPFKEQYTDPALEHYLGREAALGTLREVLPRWCEDGVAERLVQRVEAGLADEVTVSPADVMRIAGAVLTETALAPDSVAALRAALADALVKTGSRVERVVVVRHLGLSDLAWNEDRDVWAHDLLEEAEAALSSQCGKSREELDALPDRAFAALLWGFCPCRPVEANFPLFIIYTSGSTGKPKGVVHVHGGYLSGITYTMKASFDAVPGRDRIYVVADPGWITGQSYLISAALAAGIPSVVAEGAPVFPHAGRFASIIERYRITIFKAGVTFLKTVMANPQNRQDVERYDLSSLRVATFCAEPTSPAVQRFGMELMTPQYINSYWATEHGGIVWTHPYGNRDLRLRADTHCFPLPWVFGEVWVPKGEADDAGRVAYRRAEAGERGEVVITAPYPYLARTIWGDADNVNEPDWVGDAGRFRQKYFDRFRSENGLPETVYVQGDFAIAYEDGSFTFHGRSDDVINVSGHRMGTEEIEGAILKDRVLRGDSPVGNCIVVGAPHRDKGQTPVAFVLQAPESALRPDDVRRLQTLVREEKGAVAVPAAEDFIPISAFPETRSGKYMRRMLKAMILNQALGDVSTLRNPDCLDELGEKIESWKAKTALMAGQGLFEDGRFVRVRYDRVPDQRDALIATVLIDHPPVNSLSERVLDELDRFVAHLERREDVRAVIVASGRPGVFVAGADVRELLEDIDEPAEVHALAAKAHAAFGRLEAMDKPTIAAVDGAALGGGCELAMACHYRIGSARAVFGQPEINLFIPPGYGGTQRLPRLLEANNTEASAGVARALGYLLSGRRIDAEEAGVAGLLDEMTGGSSDVLVAARQLAVEAAQGRENALLEAMRHRHELRNQWRRRSEVSLSAVIRDPYVKACFQQCKRAGRERAAHEIVELVRTGMEQGIEAGLEREVNVFAELVMDGDNGGRKGIRLFLDRRSPALPVRPESVPDSSELDALARQGRLLPVGSPFVPGITPIPDWQRAWAIAKDPRTGEPDHGLPGEKERERIVPVKRPGPNEVLLYLLASEVNFNDVWAVTGIPISVFDLHDRDCHVTGSGGLGLIAAAGEAVHAEGRLQVGDVVAVYSGRSDLLDPAAGSDPMFTRFANQGYETPDGSHAQFMVVQGPQCIPVPGGLAMEQAASFVLGAGTVYRCLTHALAVQPNRRLLVEGAASGTGSWAVAMGRAMGLRAAGVVSSDERAEAVRAMGARAVNRRAGGLADLFTKVPPDPGYWADWEREGQPWLAAVRAANDGELADYVVSHAGENAFPRSFQALAEGGVIAFYGASSGYHMTFMGKPGEADPGEMLRRAGLSPGESVVGYYGTDRRELDPVGLHLIEAVRAVGGRMVLVTQTNAQRDFVLSLGYGDAVLGAVSLEAIERREPEFAWRETMPELPDAVADTEGFKRTVREFAEHTFKPIGVAVGRLLRGAGNPGGVPDVVLERAHQDTLAISTMLVKPFTGRIVYCEDMAGWRYSFYAPQVWQRQRRILMPGAGIVGTHLSNAAEAQAVSRVVSSGTVGAPEVHLFDWEQCPEAHQALWDNRLPELTGGARKAVLNHALPSRGIRSVDELLVRWQARDQ